jgi:hypothetical protein
MPAIPDVATFEVSSTHLRGSTASCHIEWNVARGMWRAWLDDGHQAFADDREHAALKVFALQRRNQRYHVQLQAGAKPGFNYVLIPMIVVFAAFLVFCVIGVIHVLNSGF